MVSSQNLSFNEKSSEKSSFLRFAFLATIVLWCAIPLSPNTVDSDFWGHVTYGQDTLEHGVAETATYTFTAQGHPWINHEHLSEIIFAMGVNHLGVESLLVLKAVLGCGVLLLMIRHGLQQKVHSIILGSVCVIVAINLSYYWGLRPHVLTFTFFALLITLTDWCFAGWSGRWNLPWPDFPASTDRQLSTQRLYGLWLCPPLLCIWANTHGGFLAGLAVFIAILSCRAVEIFAIGKEGRGRIIVHLICLMGVGIGATFVNPHGMQLHTWLVDSLGVPRPEIQEWHPPDLFTADALKTWLLFGFLGIGFVFSRQPRDFTQLIVIGLVLTQALSHQRHMPFVALLCGFWLPVHLESIWQRLRVSICIPGDLKISSATSAVACLLLLVLAAIFAGQAGRRLGSLEVRRDAYPVSAVQYMADQGLAGKLVVSGRWAQYALGVMGARKPGDSGVEVAFDGRFRTCYPQEVVDLHFDFFVGNGGPAQRYRSPDSPPTDPKRILMSHQPDLVLLNRRQQHAANVIRTAKSDWVLLYQDELAELWGRAQEFDREASPRYIPKSRRVIGLTKQHGTVPWPAAPRMRLSGDLVLAP